MDKPKILLRNQYCWCDTCFCNCYREAYDIENKKYFKISGTEIFQYDVIWSSFEPVKASYMLKPGEVNKIWDAELELHEINKPKRTKKELQEENEKLLKENNILQKNNEKLQVNNDIFRKRIRNYEKRIRNYKKRLRNYESKN